MTSELNLPLLAAILAAGVVVEAMVGFGSAVVSLSLAGLFWPVQRIVPIQVAVGLPLSAYLVVRYRHEIAGRQLLRTYLPFTLPGLVVGMVLMDLIPPMALDRLFGALVLALASFQLARLLAAGPAAPDRPISRSGRTVALFGAGVMHGLYAVGGPLMVLVASREGFSKGTFRATLSAQWLVLGVILAIRLALGGRYEAGVVPHLALLLIPIALAISAGEWLHHRVAERPFRIFTMGLLVVIAARLAFSVGTP